MFQRIKNRFRNIQISRDFPQYERQCRYEHEQRAQRIFSTKQLDDERKNLLARIESQASTKYDALINEKEVERKYHQAIANDTESMLSYFVRNYKQELDDLYAKKDALFSKKDELYEKRNEIRELLSEAFEKKDKAYSDLKYYKERINSWYAKSDRTPWLFGNAGKKLPKHSLFGQSFGDLDSYKYHRNTADNDVKKANSQIYSLKQEQHALNAEIGQVKEEIGALSIRIDQAKKDRSKMYELKKSGYNRRDLQSKIDGLFVEINKLSSGISIIEANKEEYIVVEKHRYGVMDLEAKIRDIEQKRSQFLNSFELEENQKERKRVHREAWLKQRGMA
jgi:uncharacterized coiled-coil DUF342 family protein